MKVEKFVTALRSSQWLLTQPRKGVDQQFCEK